MNQSANQDSNPGPKQGPNRVSNQAPGYTHEASQASDNRFNPNQASNSHPKLNRRSVQAPNLLRTAAENRGVELESLRGVLFDCYRTLIDISTDEDSLETYDPVSKWLMYQVVKISPDLLSVEYKSIFKEEQQRLGERYPEAGAEKVLETICQSHALWINNQANIGIRTAIVLRASSLRKLGVYPQSLRLLPML